MVRTEGVKKEREKRMRQQSLDFGAQVSVGEGAGDGGARP